MQCLGKRSFPRISRHWSVWWQATKLRQSACPWSKITGRPRSTSRRPWWVPITTRGEVTAPHSCPVLPMPPGMPALSLTSHSLSVDETSRSVCITVGAQWPILRRLEKPRRR